MLVENCVFEKNYAINVAYGGAITIAGKQKAPD